MFGSKCSTDSKITGGRESKESGRCLLLKLRLRRRRELLSPGNPGSPYRIHLYRNGTMSAKDLYHDIVKNALFKAGWTITHDPYTMTFGQKDVFVDLGAERMIGAEKGSEKIAV